MDLRPYAYLAIVAGIVSFLGTMYELIMISWQSGILFALRIHPLHIIQASTMIAIICGGIVYLSTRTPHGIAISTISLGLATAPLMLLTLTSWI